MQDQDIFERMELSPVSHSDWVLHYVWVSQASVSFSNFHTFNVNVNNTSKLPNSIYLTTLFLTPILWISTLLSWGIFHSFYVATHSTHLPLPFRVCTRNQVCLWNYAGDDVADMVSRWFLTLGDFLKVGIYFWTFGNFLKVGIHSRSSRVVTTFEQLLGGEELYHYHSKLMMKEVVDVMMMMVMLLMMMIRRVTMMMLILLIQAETGGQHVWHQDYGYWWSKI